MDRPTFFYKKMPVRAAGILVYTTKQSKRHYLFRKVKGKWTDMGGKTDIKDSCFEDTAIREAGEETNWHLFDAQDQPTQFTEKMRFYIRQRSTRLYYSHKAKYLLYVVHVPCTLMANMKRFSLEEAEDHMKHYYKWFFKIPMSLHFRIKYMRFDT